MWQRLTRVCLVCLITRSATPPYHFLTSLSSMVLMPILISTNLDSRSLICHESIANIDIISSPFDQASSNCPISIPTLSTGGDIATLPLTVGHPGVTWWPAMGPEVTCSAIIFESLKVSMSGECLVPFSETGEAGRPGLGTNEVYWTERQDKRRSYNRRRRTRYL